jgi:hypothetical protein
MGNNRRMSWSWRVIIIVPVAVKASAEQAARAINSGGPDYDGDAFTSPLSSGGTNPPTHWGLYTSATDEMVAGMASALPQIGGAMFWRHGIDGTLAASNVTVAAGQAWGWAQSLDAAGLADIHGPL